MACRAAWARLAVRYMDGWNASAKAADRPIVKSIRINAGARHGIYTCNISSKFSVTGPGAHGLPVQLMHLGVSLRRGKLLNEVRLRAGGTPITAPWRAFLCSRSGGTSRNARTWRRGRLRCLKGSRGGLLALSHGLLPLGAPLPSPAAARSGPARLGLFLGAPPQHGPNESLRLDLFHLISTIFYLDSTYSRRFALGTGLGLTSST